MWNQPSLFLVALFVAVVPTKTYFKGVDCVNIEPRIKLLVNDDETFLLEQKQASLTTPSSDIHVNVRVPLESSGSPSTNHQHHYDMYRSSELRRLSYEMIHRILRDENEPIYRRKNADLQSFYGKPSPERTHEIYRRAAQAAETLTPQHKPALQLLNLTRSNLTSLSVLAYSIKDYEQIRVLDLSVNGLNEINLTIFSQLQWADLSQNSIESLPDIVSSNLVSLNLNSNRISRGSPTLDCANLRELHLGSNVIRNLTILNFSVLHSLETLDLSCNLIETLEASYFPRQMKNLKHLNLAGNRLVSIYRETFYNLLNLNTLILKSNNIEDIDYETFLALSNLQYLDLSRNQLKPQSIRALQGIPELVGLSIAHNPKLGAFMQEFVASWSLKKLDASGTGLCQIPAALAQSVRSLRLAENWLQVISCGDLDSYPLLQQIDLSHGRIENIEDDALGRLEILEVLFLGNNFLKNVPASLPVSLQHLFLQHNQIMDIQIQAFQGLLNLKTLDLSHNKLLYLPALPLPRLITLNLQYSNLHGLNQAVVRTLPRLRDLLLEGNPIKCSELLGMAEWASPCLISEPITSARDLTQQKLPQEFEQADFKENQFIQTYSFFDHFKSDCSASLHLPRNEHRPVCAGGKLETNDVASTPTSKRVITFNLSSDVPIHYDKNFPSKVYEDQAEIGSQDSAPPKLLQSSESNEVIAAAAAPAATTNGKTLSSSPTPTGNNNNNSKNVRTAETNSKSILATSTIITKATNGEITEVTTAETLSNNTSKTNLSNNPIKLPLGLVAIKTTSAKDANHVEPNTTHSNLINSKNAKTTTTTTAAATSAAIYSDSNQLPNQITQTTMKLVGAEETSTLSKSNEVGGKTKIIDAMGTGTTTTTTQTTTIEPEFQANTTSPETKSETIYSLLPQTISTTIKSTSNYVETTSLLSRKGLKTSGVELLEDSEEIKKIGCNSKELTKTKNKLKYNGISGQPHFDVTPFTAASTILANNLQQELKASSAVSSHKHGPLQLHVKDRHLIGTPLLVHKEHNILVDPGHLILATLPTTAKSVTANEAQTENRAVTAGKGSWSAGKLDRDQKLVQAKESHLLAAITSSKAPRDKLPIKEPITQTVNEQEKMNDVEKFSPVEENDIQKEEIINITSNTEDAINGHPPAETHPGKPQIGLSKKKLSLTMKKMTIKQTKQTTSIHIQSQEQHRRHDHRTLNTKQENETITNRDADNLILVDRQQFKDFKSGLNESRLNSNLPYSSDKQYNSVNTEIKPSETMRHAFYELPPHTEDKHHASVTKPEQWLDVRKAKNNSGHPGLILLFSFVLVILLLLGLIQVYHCDKNWRQQPISHRPHQLQFNDEGDGNSFLSFHNQQPHGSQSAFPHDWLQDSRQITSRCLQLHNLQIREIQKDETAQLQRGIVQKFSNFEKPVSISSGDNDRTSSRNPHIISATGDRFSNDAFYIEMTPDSGPQMTNPYTDLLPMELLSYSGTRQSPNPTRAHKCSHNLPEKYEPRVTGTEPETSSNGTTVMDVYHDDYVSVGSDNNVPLVKLTTKSRKFDLW